jgi:hypothetical protein
MTTLCRRLTTFRSRIVQELSFSLQDTFSPIGENSRVAEKLIKPVGLLLIKRG